VLGAGSWGSTVASLVAPRHPTILWARSAEVAQAIHVEHTNRVYLPGFALAALVLLTGLLAYWFVVGKLASRHTSF